MASVPPFEDFLLRELWRAYEEARKGKRKTVDEHRFEVNDMENIILLRDSVIRRCYQPSRGVTFVVHDPVIREIVAAPFRDRVIHHFLFNICAAWWDRRFSVDSYSCRKGKGVLYGQKRLAHHVAQVTKNYKEPGFSVVLDIQSYFLSLSHNKLYERICWGLDRQFKRGVDPKTLSPDYFIKNQITCRPYDRDQLYQTVKFLWQQIIYDDPMRNIIVRGSKAEWAALPANKSLFNRKPGHGIVIGNLTSQLISNIFLDQLDRFVTIDLGYKHYGRYVDDFFIVVPMSQKHQLMRDVGVIEKYLREELELTLHPHKRRTQPVDKGVPFIGAVVYPGFIVPGHRARRKAHQAAYSLATNGTGEVEGFLSREGTMVHINSRKFFKNLFDRFGWEYDWVPDEEWQARKQFNRKPKNSKNKPHQQIARQLPLITAPASLTPKSPTNPYQKPTKKSPSRPKSSKSPRKTPRKSHQPTDQLSLFS